MAKFFKKAQRTLWSFSLSLAAAALLASCEKTSDNVQPEPTAAAPVQDIVTPRGIKGINVQMRDGTVNFGKIHTSGFNTVRIVIDVNDYHFTHVSATTGIRGVGLLMRQANAAGLSVILAYYNHTFMDPSHYRADAMAKAADFWVANLPYLKNVGVPFDLNIINEPCFKSGNTYRISGAQWRDEQNIAIDRIHHQGYTGRLIIDAPGFGHETAYIRAHGSEVAVGSPIMYSLHVYPDSFYNGGLPTNPAQDQSFMADLRGQSHHQIIFGEFGDYGGGRNDQARVQAFVNHAQTSSADCGAIAWAWNGDNTPGKMNASLDGAYLAWIQRVVPN